MKFERGQRKGLHPRRTSASEGAVFAGVVKLVNTVDLKSAGLRALPVQARPSVPFYFVPCASGAMERGFASSGLFYLSPAKAMRRRFAGSGLFYLSPAKAMRRRFAGSGLFYLSPAKAMRRRFASSGLFYLSPVKAMRRRFAGSGLFCFFPALQRIGTWLNSVLARVRSPACGPLQCWLR